MFAQLPHAEDTDYRLELDLGRPPLIIRALHTDSTRPACDDRVTAMWQALGGAIGIATGVDTSTGPVNQVLVTDDRGMQWAVFNWLTEALNWEREH